MPNHITNILEFECTPERFKVIAESLKSNPDEPLGQVDFNTLIPMPESLAIEAGSRGEKGYKAYKEFVIQAMPLDDAGKDKLEASFRDRFKDDPETWELGKQYFQNIQFLSRKMLIDPEEILQERNVHGQGFSDLVEALRRIFCGIIFH